MECFLERDFTNCLKKASIYEKEVERVLNEEDDPLDTLDDIEEDSVQTLGANLAFLMKERFGDQVNPNIMLDAYIDFDIKSVQRLGN